MQRVSRAAVHVERREVGEIGPGLCVLLSVDPSDTERTARHFAARIAGLRIFPDENGKMNLDLEASGGQVLVVSQFTLHADTSRGHRPSFIAAAPPDQARRLCDEFTAALKEMGHTVATGEFGAHMDVSIENKGPVTLVLTSGEDAWNADSG